MLSEKEFRMGLMVLWLIGTLTASPMNLCSLPERASSALGSASVGFEAALDGIKSATDAASHSEAV
jgi:hypothetical protein